MPSPNSSDGEPVEGALEVRHRDALVDGEALDLVEGGHVRRVELVGAEDPADRGDVDRHAALEEGAGLDRRGVGAQDEAALGRVDVEGVLHLPGRVVGVEVQGVEVEPLRLDLGSLGDLPAHPDEQVGDALRHQLDGVAAAERAAARGQGDVDGLLGEDPLVALGLELGLAGGERLGDPAAGLADALAGLGLRARGQRPDLAVGERERALVALVRAADPLSSSRDAAAAAAARAAVTASSTACGSSAATSTGS